MESVAMLALVAMAVEAGSGCTGTDTIVGNVRIVTDTLPDGVVGQAYGPVPLRASPPGSQMWSLRSDSGPLPDGLAIGNYFFDGCRDGSICGTPTRPGTWSFIVDVDDDNNEDSKTLSITINPVGGGNGTLHFSWTVEGGLAQCRGRTVKLDAGTVSETHPCTDGAATMDLPTHTYGVTMTLLETNGEVTAIVDRGPAVITAGATVAVTADFVGLFPGSAHVVWTVSGAPAGCAASGIAEFDMSFSDIGTFPLGTLVPCVDGSRLFPVLDPRDFTMRAMPLRADGSCFERADTTCISVTAAASVRSAARTEVAFDVPSMVGSVTAHWTINGVTPSARACAGADSVRVSVVPVGGTPFVTKSFACTDGTGSFDVPAGLYYQLDADVVLTDGTSADRRNTVQFFVDYGAVVDAPLLPFVLGSGYTIEDLGGPLDPVVPQNMTVVDVGRVPLVLDDQGNPWIATLERDVGAFYFTYVRKWNGSAWVTVGPGIPFGSRSGYGGLPALILDAQGQPVVAATHYPPSASSPVMQVLRFDGSAWQDLSLPSTAPSSTVALALAPSGDLVIAWAAHFATSPFYRLEIAKYTSGSWHTLADLPVLQRNAGSLAYNPSVAVTPAGDTIVAWDEVSAMPSGPLNPTYVDRIVGTVVTPLGDAVDSTQHAVNPYPSVAVDPAGTIYVAYAPTQPGQNSSGIRVTTWTGSAWQNVGDLLPGYEGNAYPPFNLTIHPQTHQPVVGAPYLGGGARTVAGVWTFDGTTWNQVGSDLIDDTLVASVAVDAQGRYVIVGQVLTGVQTGTTIVRRVTP